MIDKLITLHDRYLASQFRSKYLTEDQAVSWGVRAIWCGKAERWASNRETCFGLAVSDKQWKM